MSRVAIIQEVLTQYRTPFYAELRDQLARQGVELVLIHGSADKRFAQRRDESSLRGAILANNQYMQLGSHRVVWQAGAMTAARSADLVIVEHANRQLINYGLLLRAALGWGPDVAFWGHGANLQSSAPNGFRERFKRHIALHAHWWFAYTEGSAARIQRHGFAPERITVVQNAIDLSVYQDVSKEKNEFECVFVGALYEQKRIRFLLDAAQHLAAMVPGFRLRIIGDGPERALVEARRRTEPWLLYEGPMFGKAKAAAVSRASLLLMPGLVGLAVLDAFAGETPLVTTAVSFHSPEIEYLCDGSNGVVMEESTSAEEYACQVAHTLRDRATLSRLRQGCRESAAVITLPEMASRFAGGILAALGHSSRRK